VVSARGPVIGALALGFALALQGGGCTQIVGLDYHYQGTGGGSTSTATTSTTSGMPSKCGTFVFDTLSTCQTCMEASCCTDVAACDKDSPCDALLTCERKCAPFDDACKQTCLTADTMQHAGAGLTAYTNVYNCYLTNCEYTAGCDWPVCNSTFLWYNHQCADCLGMAGCCEAFTACAADSVCSACVLDSTTPGCSMNAKYGPTQTCVNTTCAKECVSTICGSTLGYASSDCNDCINNMTGGCCTEFAACVMDPMSTCYKCMYATQTTGCNADAMWNAFSNCQTNNCEAACAFL
jgi:hypothetical protein